MRVVRGLRDITYNFVGVQCKEKLKGDWNRTVTAMSECGLAGIGDESARQCKKGWICRTAKNC